MIHASFNNIQSSITENIQKATQEIKIAVAWFTNKDILGELIGRADNGVKCTVLISDDLINKKLNLDSYVKHGGELKIIPSEHSKFLHEKFAIFDSKTLIMGSYNYTYNAEYNNLESVVLTDDNQLIQQYQIRFKNIYNSAKEYEKNILISNQSEGIIESENKLAQREKDLKDELLNSLAECKKLKINLNYSGIYDLIERYGAIGTPKRLIATGINYIQSGFLKLALHERLDLTFEYIITKEKYKSLFDEKTINDASKRLETKK
jgi:PLD-like domain